MFKGENRFSILLFVFSVLFFTVYGNNVLAVENSKKDYLILFDEKANKNLREEMFRKNDIKTKYNFKKFPIITAELTEQQALALSKDKNIKKIELDLEIKLQNNLKENSSYEIPNMTEEDQVINWFSDKIYSESISKYNLTGKGVNVAIMDTGISTIHKELKVSENLDCTGENFSCIKKTYEPPIKVIGDGDEGGGYHGTHVAGIIGAKKDTIGVEGVAPNANLFDLTIYEHFDSKSKSNMSSIIKGLEWIVEKNTDLNKDNDIHVLNMSFGAYTIPDTDEIPGYDFDIFHNAIKDVYNSGTVLVASTGNDFGDYVNFPAIFPEVIGVSATKQDDSLAKFSNFGYGTNLSAPGYYIYSTIPYVHWDEKYDKYQKIIDWGIFHTEERKEYARNKLKQLGNSRGYMYVNGTSMAAPIVTGVAALYREQFPAATNKEIMNMLYETATDVGEKGFDFRFGYGIVNSNPPKHHIINDFVNLKSATKYYEVANLLSPVSGTFQAGIYSVLKAKNWSSNKQRFEFYYIESSSGSGWIRNEENKILFSNSEHPYQEIILDSSIKFYDEPNNQSVYITKSINKYKANVIVSKDVYEESWDKTFGNYRWFKVNIPEYSIKNKWIYVNGDQVKPIYQLGLLDSVSGNIINVKGVTNSNYIFDNNNGTYSYQLGGFAPNSQLTYKLDHPLTVNTVYLKHANASNDSFIKLDLELTIDNGKEKSVKPYSISEENLTKEYFSIPSVENVVSFTLKNNSNIAVNMAEFEIFGTYDGTDNKPLQPYKVDKITLSSAYIKKVYDSPSSQSLYQNIENYNKPVEVVNTQGWNYSNSYYSWYKINIPDLNIYNKWIHSSQTSPKPVYRDGIFDKLYSKVVTNNGVSSVANLTDNINEIYSISSFPKGSSVTYRIGSPINEISNVYLKTLDLNLSFENKPIFEITFETSMGEKISKIITEDALLYDFQHIGLKTAGLIEFITIKNISESSINLSEFELYNPSYQNNNPHYDSIENEITLNGYKTFYDEFDSYSPGKTLNSGYQKIVSSKAARWDPSYGNYSWFLVNTTEPKIDDKWMVRSSDTISPIFAQGITDLIEGKVVQHTATNPNNIIDDNIASYIYSTFQSNQYIKYRFASPVTIEKVYIKHDLPLRNTNYSLQLDFITKQGKTITQVINEDNLYRELFDVGLGHEQIEYVVIKNIGTGTAYPLEIEFFGESNASEEVVNHVITLKGYTSVYDKHDTYSLMKTVNFSSPITVTSKQSFDFNLGNAFYNWYKIDVPEYNIKDKWVLASSSMVSPVYKSGMLNTGNVTVTSTNVTYPNYLYDNDLASYNRTSFKPSGNITFAFNEPTNINQFYLKFYTTHFTYNNQLKVVFTRADGSLAGEKIIDETDFMLEFVDCSNLRLTDVKNVSIVNTSTNTIELLEFDVF